MKVVIEFEAPDDYDSLIEDSAYSLYDFFYGVDDGQGVISKLRVTKIPSPFEEDDD